MCLIHLNQDPPREAQTARQRVKRCLILRIFRDDGRGRVISTHSAKEVILPRATMQMAHHCHDFSSAVICLKDNIAHAVPPIASPANSSRSCMDC